MSTLCLQDDPSRPQRRIVGDDQLLRFAQGQALAVLRPGDVTGLTLLLTWQVNAGLVSVEEAAYLPGVTPRTVRDRCATYARTTDSADLVDRRRFNPGRQMDYRMEAHRAKLVAQWTRNMVSNQSTSGRHLAEHLRASPAPGTAPATGRSRLSGGTSPRMGRRGTPSPVRSWPRT
jgi:hypothetical protein